MKTLFLDAGHSLSDSGAVATHKQVTYKEADLTIDLRNRLLENLAKRKDVRFKVLLDKDSHNLVRTFALAKAQLQVGDWLCSIHFNAGSGTASGVEVFVAQDASPESIKLGKAICTSISQLLNIPNRGLKSEVESVHKRLGILHCSSHAYLIEVCFITNKTDLQLYFKNQEALVQTLSNLFITHI